MKAGRKARLRLTRRQNDYETMCKESSNLNSFKAAYHKPGSLKK